MMLCNVGGVDRTLRAVIGVALIIFGLLVPMTLIWQILVFVVAAILLVTAIMRFCPASAIFGINTCANAQKGSGSPEG